MFSCFRKFIKMEDGENNEHVSNLSNTSDNSEETEVGSSNVATKKSRGKVFKVKCGFPESMVSVVEAHTPASRAILDQQRLEDEVVVAWNGEDTFHCDPVVKKSIRYLLGKLQKSEKQRRTFHQEK